MGHYFSLVATIVHYLDIMFTAMSHEILSMTREGFPCRYPPAAVECEIKKVTTSKILWLCWVNGLGTKESEYVTSVNTCGLVIGC